MIYTGRPLALSPFFSMFFLLGCSEDSSKKDREWEYVEQVDGSSLTFKGYYEAVDYSGIDYYQAIKPNYENHKFYIEEESNSYFSQCLLFNMKQFKEKPSGFLIEKNSKIKVDKLYEITASISRSNKDTKDGYYQSGSRAAFMEISGTFVKNKDGQKAFRITSYSIDPCKTAVFTTGCAVPKEEDLCFLFEDKNAVAISYKVENRDSLGETSGIEQTPPYNARYRLNVEGSFGDSPSDVTLTFEALSTKYLLLHNASTVPYLKPNPVLGVPASFPGEPPLHPGFGDVTFETTLAEEKRAWVLSAEKPSWLLLSPATKTHRVSLFGHDPSDGSVRVHVWGTLPLENTIPLSEAEEYF